MNNGSSWLVLVILMLFLAACGLLGVDLNTENPAQQAEFQRLTGGLGFGPAVDLSRCAFNFDPRICPDCSQQFGPIPGGSWFCPQHGCSILYYPSLRNVQNTEP